VAAKTLYDKLWDAHLVQQRDDAFARRTIPLHLAHQVQQFALATQSFIEPESAAWILGLDHAPQGVFLLVAEIAEPVLGALQQALVTRPVLRGLVFRKAHLFGEFGILLRMARRNAVDLGRGQGGHQVGDVRRGLFRQHPHAAGQFVAQRQRVADLWLACCKGLALAQQGDVIGQLGLAVPGSQTGQTLARQRILLRRKIEVLIDPPAGQAVGIAIAQPHGAAGRQEQGGEECENQRVDETVHGWQVSR